MFWQIPGSAANQDIAKPARFTQTAHGFHGTAKSDRGSPFGDRR